MAHHWNRTPAFDHKPTQPYRRKSWQTIERYACRCGVWGETKPNGDIEPMQWNDRVVFKQPQLYWMDGTCAPLEPAVAPAPPPPALTDWSDAELGGVLMSQLLRWLDAAGESEGRSRTAIFVEALRDLQQLPLPVGGDVDSRPSDNALLDEAKRRFLARRAKATS